MKSSKYRLFFLVFPVLVFSVFKSPAENLQIVLPKIIYIGDTVEIRYIFHSEAKLFGDEFQNPTAKLNLRTDFPAFLEKETDFSLISANLEKINSEYTFSITLIPWKTGFISFQPLNLVSLVTFSQKKENASFLPPFLISLSPIEVNSIVKKTGATSFRPLHPPLVIPGTTTLLIILAVLFIVLFSILLFALLHMPQISRFIGNLTYLYSLKKNSRKSIKKLIKLKKNQENYTSDKNFASEIQHILRDFLNNRFSQNFSSMTTQNLYSLFTDFSGGSLTVHQQNTIESLISIFTRLDYIRFARNAAFLTAGCNNGISERLSICESSIKLIEDFDADEESQEEDL
ncbi:hypothetical protein [Treponema sp.]|uniref:hypothetical protein n=1 Tax=Treponema sp. TaxID=166 RepID=UPI00388E7661